MDLKRYVSGLKKDAEYAKGIEDTLEALSKNLGISYLELHHGLFFAKGTAAMGGLRLSGELSQKELDAIRGQWYSAVIKGEL